jgi:IS5 family transposase
VIEMRRKQLSFGDGLIAEEVSDLREDWMKHADEVLADEETVAIVYEALAKRHPKSRCRGRRGTPADAVLRLLILKHVRNWSYGVLEREVRANLVYRDFTRVGGGKMPDAKTMGRWGIAIGPQVVKQIHERIVKIAHAKGVITGQRMRVDTTVVETNIHYPTDSTLLGDGVRVLTRTMKKITKIVGAIGTKLRDRSRSVKLRLVEIGRADACQRSDQSGQVEAALSLIVEHDEPGGGAGQALRRGNRRRREAGDECVEAVGTGRPAGASRWDATGSSDR